MRLPTGESSREEVDPEPAHQSIVACVLMCAHEKSRNRENRCHMLMTVLRPL